MKIALLTATMLVAVAIVSAQTEPDAGERGAQLLRAAIQARGGDSYLGFKTLIATGQYTPFDKGMSTIPTPFTDMIAFPDKERTEFGKGKKKNRRINVNVGLTGWVYDGDAETLKDQTEKQIREFADDLEYDLDRILRHGWQAQGARVRFSGREETRPGERADVVEVQLSGERKVFLWLDRYTHLPLSLVYERVNDQGISKNEIRFSQFVAYDGVKFPNIVDFFRDGVQINRINYEQIRLNAPISDEIFLKPASAKAVK
jgi:hypothetical protein